MPQQGKWQKWGIPTIIAAFITAGATIYSRRSPEAPPQEKASSKEIDPKEVKAEPENRQVNTTEKPSSDIGRTSANAKEHVVGPVSPSIQLPAKVAKVSFIVDGPWEQAAWLLDGNPVEPMDPFLSFDLSSGSHKLVGRRSGFKDCSFEWHVRDDNPSSAPIPIRCQ